MTSTSDWRLVATATAVIAATYGLGRYAFGLLVPGLADGLGLSATAIGLAGGASHVGYALGLLLAPRASSTYGPERVAVAAAAAASLGLAGIAASGGVATLTLAVAVAGSGSGLASPALAELVVLRLPPPRRSAAQTWVNSGTSVGLAASAPAVALAWHWRAIWAALAAVGVVVAVAAWQGSTCGRAARSCHGAAASLPAAPTAADGRDTAAPRLVERRTDLIAFAVALGASSAAYWTFSRQHVLAGGASTGWSIGFWALIGVFGVAGGSAGAAAERFGLRATLLAWSGVWVVALAALAIPALPTTVALASAGGFGAAYMALTGLAILWAAGGDGSPAASVRTCFLALGLGQATATPLAGIGADTWGLPGVFAASAVAGLALFAAAARLRGGRPAQVLTSGA